MSKKKDNFVEHGVYPAKLVFFSKPIVTKKKDTEGKDYDVKYMKVTFELTEENKGHRVYDIFLLDHFNEEALQIHQDKLNDFKEACGHKADEKVSMFKLKEKVVELGLKVEKDSYGTKNKIAFFKVPSKDKAPN